MAEQKFMVTDPHSATRGGEIVARHFKTAANAQRWLDKKKVADPDGYDGCLVEPMPLPTAGVDVPREGQQ